jgi:hypothetical protein
MIKENGSLIQANFCDTTSASLPRNSVKNSLISDTHTLNPWNHRADISAQAYLKPSKMSKINVTELFLPNTLWKICGDSEKNTRFS